MESTGISLNSNPEEKKDDSKSARSLFIGIVAGVALAAALGGAFLLGGRNGGEGAAAQPSSAVGQATGGAAVDDNEDGASTGNSESEVANNGGDNGNDGGVIDEPTVAPDEPEADEPTATPTNTPTNTPTATPTPDFECVVCPEGLGLGIEEPVVPPCGEDCVIDGGFIVELPGLAFEDAFVNVCDGFVAMKAEIQGNAEMWVTYSKEWQVTIESEHQFGESFFLGETGEWVWFGDWGWLYPIDIVFHAEDAEGNQIEKEIHQLNYVC